MKACPKCQREWQAPCDQTNCIDLFGECISCRRFRLTDDEVKQIEILSEIQTIRYEPTSPTPTPAKKERVGLTDDEMYEIVRAEGKVLKAHARDIVEKLQAKLKEKNS
ncbi:MAG: hypothetical protein WBI20_15015 [Burkholderiaceae bacterium]